MGFTLTNHSPFKISKNNENQFFLRTHACNKNTSEGSYCTAMVQCQIKTKLDSFFQLTLKHVKVTIWSAGDISYTFSTFGIESWSKLIPFRMCL